MLVIVGHELELDARYPALLLDPAPLDPALLDPALLGDSSVGTRPASKEQGRRRCQFRGAARDAAAG